MPKIYPSCPSMIHWCTNAAHWLGDILQLRFECTSVTVPFKRGVGIVNIKWIRPTPYVGAFDSFGVPVILQLIVPRVSTASVCKSKSNSVNSAIWTTSVHISVPFQARRRHASVWQIHHHGHSPLRLVWFSRKRVHLSSIDKNLSATHQTPQSQHCCSTAVIEISPSTSTFSDLGARKLLL